MHDEFVGNENPEVIGERRWWGRRNGREDVGIGGRGGRRGGGDGRGTAMAADAGAGVVLMCKKKGYLPAGVGLCIFASKIIT